MFFFYWITTDGIQHCLLDLYSGITLIDNILAGTGHGSHLNSCNLAAYLSRNDPGLLVRGLLVQGLMVQWWLAKSNF